MFTPVFSRSFFLILTFLLFSFFFLSLKSVFEKKFSALFFFAFFNSSFFPFLNFCFLFVCFFFPIHFYFSFFLSFFLSSRTHNLFANPLVGHYISFCLHLISPFYSPPSTHSQSSSFFHANNISFSQIKRHVSLSDVAVCRRSLSNEADLGTCYFSLSIRSDNMICWKAAATNVAVS